MANTKMQEAVANQVEEQPKIGQRTASEALEHLGGFMTIKSIIPAAADMNPAKAATKKIFMTDKKYKAKREALASELKGWLEVLSLDKSNRLEYVEACNDLEKKYNTLLSENVTNVLQETKQLETSYRTLDQFFKNAGEEKLYNLSIVNVSDSEFDDDSSNLSQEIDNLVRDRFDRLSMRESFGLMVIPGYKMKEKPTLLKWAKIAHKYKVMMITDHDQERDFDSLMENTSGYKDSDAALQNVVMTGNWIVGREKELLSNLEAEDDGKAFYVPASGALAGKLYDENANLAQGAAGKKFGTLEDVKGVEVDLLKSQIATLMDNHVVPMVYSEGRVMAFNNSTLYDGADKAMTEYPIVRVFDWVKKVLMNFVHDIACENWDPQQSPKDLQEKIKAFLNSHMGYGGLFQDYKIEWPVQDPATNRVSIDVSIVPYFAAKNFTIRLSADKKEKNCEDL